MGGLLDAESEAIQFQSAKDLLNRGPLAAHQGAAQGQGGMQITLDHQALHAILAGALNMGHHGIVAAFTSLNQPDPPSNGSPTVSVSSAPHVPPLRHEVTETVPPALNIEQERSRG